MDVRSLPIKQTLQLLTDYTLSIHDLIAINNGKAIIINWKNLQTPGMQQTAKLMQMLTEQIEDNSETLSIIHLKQLKLNIMNMHKALKKATKYSEEKNMSIKELSDPNYPVDCSEDLQNIFLHLLDLLTEKLQVYDDKPPTSPLLKSPSLTDPTNELADDEFDLLRSVHPHEQQLLTASLKKIQNLLKNFPSVELNVFSGLDNIRNQLKISKKGDLIVTKESLISKLLNLRAPFPMSLMETVLSKADTAIDLIILSWPNQALLRAFSTNEKNDLRESFATLSNCIQVSFMGIIELQRVYTTNNLINMQLEEFKARLLLMAKSLESCRISIPPDDVFVSLIEQIECAKDAMDIGTTEDLMHALKICKSVLKACEISKEEGTAIRELAYHLKVNILSTFEVVKKEEDKLEIMLNGVREKLSQEKQNSTFCNLTYIKKNQFFHPAKCTDEVFSSKHLKTVKLSK